MAEFDNTNRIVGWKQTAKNGTTYLSLRINVEGKEYKGALFAETDKKSEKSPDYTGKVDVTDSQNGGWEKARATFKPDEVAEVSDEEEINLDSIPF